MSDDLPNRLRTAAQWTEVEYDVCSRETLHEAADEIISLRERNTKLVEALRNMEKELDLGRTDRETILQMARAAIEGNET